MATNRKLIFKERLDYEEADSTRLSYDVIFRKPEFERQIEEQEAVEQQQQVEEALAQQKEQFESRLQVEKQQAAQQGYDKGFSEGQEEARNLISESLETFRQSLAELDTRLTKLTEEIKPGVTSMVFDLAEKVIQVPVQSDELTEIVRSEVERIVRGVDDELKITIYVSPDDFDAIEEMVAQFDLKRIDVKANQSLQPGEYGVETNEETVVRRFQKSLRDMREELNVEDWGLNARDERDD